MFTCRLFLDERFRPPGNGDQKSHQGNIHVPVRHGLRAHLDDPDDRDQRSQVPQPANDQVGKFPGLSNDNQETETSSRSATPIFHTGGIPAWGYKMARSAGQIVFPIYST